MKPISSQSKMFIRKYYPFIKIRKNNNIVINLDDNVVEIPSEMYPLNNRKTLRVFTYADTQELGIDTKIASLYNEQEFKVGFCYQNTDNMAKALKKHQFKNVDTYVGWITIGDKAVHHCWLVYNDKHVLDPGVSKIQDIVRERMIEEDADIERGREILLELYNETKETPNSHILTFGQVAPFAIYVGTKCNPELGRQIFSELMEKYPNHPSYRDKGMNPQGLSKVQKMIYGDEFK